MQGMNSKGFPEFLCQKLYKDTVIEPAQANMQKITRVRQKRLQTVHIIVA